jgi:Skp family chaperone for outer membrane proteins
MCRVEMARRITEMLRRTVPLPIKRMKPAAFLYISVSLLKNKIMKKIFTLFVAVGSITLASAQGISKQNNRTYNGKVINTNVHVNNGFKNSERSVYDQPYTFSSRDRDAAIDKIQREYAYKVTALKRDRYLKPNNKNKQLQLLARQRDLEIKAVQDRFYENNSRNSAYNNSKRRY